MNGDAQTILTMLRMLKKVIRQGRKERGPRGVLVVWYVEGSKRLRTKSGIFFSIREEQYG